MRTPARLVAALLGLALSCAPARQAPEKAKEIVFWESCPDAALAPLVADFEAAHPGIKVRLEHLSREDGLARILAAADTGSVPDLCEVRGEWMPRLLAGEKLSDWSAGVADQRTLLRGWELCSIGESLFGMPWTLETEALFYNRGLLRRARWDPGKPPATWADLSLAAAKVQRLGPGTRGFGLPTSPPGALAAQALPWLWSAGGDVLSADRRHAVLDSAQAVEALGYLVKLRRAGVTDSRDAIERSFMAGRLGFVLAGPRLLRRIRREAPGLDFAVAPLPAPARGDTAVSWASGEVLVSFTGSKRKMEALELARFLVRPENAVRIAAATAMLPPGVGADTSAAFRGRHDGRVLLRQLANARYVPNHPAWGAMQAALEDGFGQALAGRQDAAGAVRAVQARLDSLVRTH